MGVSLLCFNLGSNPRAAVEAQPEIIRNSLGCLNTSTPEAILNFCAFYVNLSWLDVEIYCLPQTYSYFSTKNAHASWEKPPWVHGPGHTYAYNGWLPTTVCAFSLTCANLLCSQWVSEKQISREHAHFPRPSAAGLPRPRGSAVFGRTR